MRPPVPPLGATVITTTTMTAAMLGAVVAVVAGAALAPAVLPPAHAAAGEPGTLAFSFGEQGSSSPYEFTQIRDVAMAPDGKIVVFDSRARDALRIFHPNGTLHAGVNLDSWRSYYAVNVFPNGSIVLTGSDRRAMMFDPNGVHVTTFESWWLGGFSRLPLAPNGNVVMIENASRIGVYHLNGTHMFSFGEYGGYYGELKNAYSVGVGPTGKIFVESGNKRIEVFHPNGTHAATTDTSFCTNYRCSPFSIGPSGEFLVHGSHYYSSGRPILYYPNFTSVDSVRYADKFGTALGSMVGHNGYSRVYVYHGIGSASERLSPPPVYLPPGPPAYVPPAARPLSLAGGSFAFEFGSYGEGPGEFLAPRNIAFGPGDVIAVSDAENNRIQLFHPNGTFAFELGLRGSGPGELRGPYGLTFGSNGLLAVSDVGNHRVQVFRIQ